MFGIGFGELLVVFLVLLIAVGPKSMPKLMKTVGKGVREFRQATRDIRNQVGIDELMRDESLKDPLGLRQLKIDAMGPPTAHPREGALNPVDLDNEVPAEGVDLRHARDLSARLELERLEVEAAEREAASADEGVDEGAESTDSASEPDAQGDK